MVFTPEPSVAIILVNWNGLDFTMACLESLRKVDFTNFKVILVDNASQNPEGKQLKAAFPEIQLIENTENLGFAGGNNTGIRFALAQGYSHVLLLNNDTKVSPDFLLELMLKMQQQPQLGIVQPLILFLDEPQKIWSAGGRWIGSFSRAVTLGDREPLADYRFKNTLLDWATGCCMLINREAILKTGLLNEQFFAYFEDVEWSLRFRQAGFGIALAERAIIYHEGGASSRKKNPEGNLNPKVFYYHVRNQFLLIRGLNQRNEGSFLVGIIFHLFRFATWMGYFAVRGRFQKFNSVGRGIRDGLGETLQNPPTWP